jgi:hypothetical protein
LILPKAAGVFKVNCYWFKDLKAARLIVKGIPKAALEAI